MANFNSLYNSTEKATIVCAENNACANGHGANGAGYYNQKPYNPTIKIICAYEHLILRSVEASTIKYEILWDGEVFNKYPTMKIAENFFIDLCGITRNKFNKLKTA